jgi:hypothetical protein
MTESVLQSRKSVTYEEYPLVIADKAFSYVGRHFQPPSAPHIDTRRQIAVEDVHKILLGLKPTDPDLAHLTFYHQGSSPYSYEVERVIGIWAMGGLVEVKGNDIYLTPLGESKS